MAITIRRHSFAGLTSTSAPAFTGQPGSMISVLDYCLTDSTYGIGWTKVYTGTNLAAYRQPSGTNQFYLYVDDSAGQNAVLRGYESMTSISAGTGAFPTTAQTSSGRYFYKSITGDSTQRGWYFISNGKIFYLIGLTGSSSYDGGLVFGDFISYKASDVYGTVLIANSGANANSSGIALYALASNMTTANSAFIARSYTQIGSSMHANHFSDIVRSSSAGMGANGYPYPDPVSGGLILAPVYINEPSVGSVRGVLPGIWDPMHNKPFATGDTFTGTNELNGKTFEVSSLAGGQVVFETSDTWVT